MERDVKEVKDTAAPTNDEQNKDLYVAVELDDTGGGGDGDKGPVIIRLRSISILIPIQKQKLIP